MSSSSHSQILRLAKRRVADHSCTSVPRIKRIEIRCLQESWKGERSTRLIDAGGPHTLRKDNVDKSIMNSLHTRGSERLRFNIAKMGACSRRLIKVRNVVLILVTATTVGGAAFTPSVASADWYGSGWHGHGNRADIRADRRDIRADRLDIHRDRADLRRDFRDLRRDLHFG